MAAIFSSLGTIFLYLFLFLFSHHALAFRPFASSDAGVIDEHRWEMKFGAKEEHTNKQNLVTAPQLEINYGIRRNWEIVTESALQVYKQTKVRENELLEPGISVKTVWREGILQSKGGPSLASEFGVLLPSTARGEGRTGVSGIGILSDKIANVDYHINLGTELDRAGLGANGIWGLIVEYPFLGKIRIGGEINGTIECRGKPDTSGMIGFIWTIHDMDWDLGVRKGFSDLALDWGITGGVTFTF